MDTHVRKQQSRPLVSELQATAQRQRLNKMVKSIFPANRDVAMVMDDEAYLTLKGNDWQGTSYFTLPTKEVSSEVKFISHTNFLKKVPLWQIISEKGMSKPLCFRFELAVNEEIYNTKSLSEVASFIKKHHKGEDAALTGSGVGPLLEAIVAEDEAAEYRYGTQVGEPTQRPPVASQREFLDKTEA